VWGIRFRATCAVRLHGVGFRVYNRGCRVSALGLRSGWGLRFEGSLYDFGCDRGVLAKVQGF